ncbi:MAG: hypothetical protein HS113_25440 [Verrucomicrobiales bacterium]|nr:hypothetical protein [Verrucomicrobiales bacterium]
MAAPLRLSLAGVLLVLAWPHQARSQDVAGLFLFKAAWYEQNAPDDPALLPAAQDPYDITALVRLSDQLLSDPEWYLWISGVILRTPAGRSEPLTPDFSSGVFSFYDGASSASALNSRYGAGTYRFTLSSVLTGNSNFDLPLAADDYPPAPKITNFDAAQAVDPTQPFLLRWVGFPGEDRVIWLEIWDEQTLETVLTEGPLDGDQTSFVIPPETLEPGISYFAQLSFSRYTHVATSTVPQAFAGFEAYNTFPLRTRSEGSPLSPSTLTDWRRLEDGDLTITVECTVGRPLILEGAAAVDGPWSLLESLVPTASPASFTVPASTLGNRLFLRTFQE